MNKDEKKIMNQLFFRKTFQASCLLLLAACNGPEGVNLVEEVASPWKDFTCTADALRAIPDVRVISVTGETAPVAHCKVSGVIGTEINFELLLPSEWNGKFVMGGRRFCRYYL